MTDTPPVLVITSLEDVTADLVLNELYGRGVPAVRLDPAVDFPDLACVSARIEGAWLAGHLNTPTRRLDLSAVRSVYWRRPSPYVDPSRVDSTEQRFAIEQCRAGYTGILTALPALHVNELFRNRAADYKPAQLTTAIRCGLTVPSSIVTNVPAEARRFVAAHAAVIYKPVHSVHVADENGPSRTVWTSLVRVDELDDSIALCPHLFQSCVPKVADIRLAAVGEHMFATRIDSGGDHLDWRYDQRLITCSPVSVPPVIRASVRSYLQAFGLVFGAFDFALDSAGTWWFLECNPNGQWAFVDQSTTQAIATALADTLQKGTTV